LVIYDIIVCNICSKTDCQHIGKTKAVKKNEKNTVGTKNLEKGLEVCESNLMGTSGLWCKAFVEQLSFTSRVKE